VCVLLDKHLGENTHGESLFDKVFKLGRKLCRWEMALSIEQVTMRCPPKRAWGPCHQGP
jgi:hypothetical protein